MSNYTYHGTSNLIALPGRSVQTFPSGLVRVDRTYACQAADAGKYRQQFAVGNILPLDDGTPAIDGLYIFPDAQEEKGSDGFYRFKVSGYGRVNTTGTSQSFFEEGRATLNSLNFAGSSGTSLIQTQTIIECVNEITTISFVVLNSNSPENNLPPTLPLRVFVRQGGELVPLEIVYPPGTTSVDTGGSLGTIQTNQEITVNNIIEDSPGTVLGIWKEVVYRLRANAIITRTSFSNN